MKTLYLIRGVSGSGKTTMAKTLEAALPDSVAYAADDFFNDAQGNYNWERKQLGRAHNWCVSQVARALADTHVENVIVHNTFSTDKEMRPYIEMAEDFGARIVSLAVENRHGNCSVHNVPEATLERQRRCLRDSLKL
ncbi:ATPase [Vibrio phage vB_VpS_PG07]|uniref:AAA domain protein n=1 Tax=Vibrio phage vB_VpS_PG07 TaxID=2301664 RepID=A0A385E7G4_9CAUD|nr:ATPase [Vibrio phage vB_VpS_PG07]AXQ66649.1 AAA domain protein [Vibrio phage vB_VpS_PG07]